jgi:hypothetical protein
MGKPKLLYEVRRKCWLRHYSHLTEQAYVGWIKRYVRFHGTTHLKNLGDDAIEAYLVVLSPL